MVFGRDGGEGGEGGVRVGVQLWSTNELTYILYLCMGMQTSKNILKSSLGSHIFWDTDIQKLDFDRYPAFTIIRVLERGSMKDIDEIIKYYGAEKVTETVTTIDTLLPRAVVLSKQLFHLSDDRFQCLKGTPRAMSYSKY